MNKDTTLEQFLRESRVQMQTWEKSECAWTALQEIAEDHSSRFNELKRFAESRSIELQNIPATHSVRFRVKDPVHVVEKIIRKCAEGREKYRDLSAGTYASVVSDLVGLRILHIYKEQCFEIDAALRALPWTLVEPPVAYHRQGDSNEILDRYTEANLEPKIHDRGYRSVHYTFSIPSAGGSVQFELQVRTIFEEGWSEIDHDVKYPHSPNSLSTGYMLQVLNRHAGSADEIGSFVLSLHNQPRAIDLDTQPSEPPDALTTSTGENGPVSGEDIGGKQSKVQSEYGNQGRASSLPSTSSPLSRYTKPLLQDLVSPSLRDLLSSLEYARSQERLAGYSDVVKSALNMQGIVKQAEADSGIRAVVKQQNLLRRQRSEARAISGLPEIQALQKRIAEAKALTSVPDIAREALDVQDQLKRLGLLDPE